MTENETKPVDCPWKIRWGTTAEHTTQCDKGWHSGLGTHEGPGLVEQFPYQRVEWMAGDRREYKGEWPGYCGPGETHADAMGICVLPAGHHGRCAP